MWIYLCYIYKAFTSWWTPVYGAQNSKKKKTTREVLAMKLYSGVNDQRRMSTSGQMKVVKYTSLRVETRRNESDGRRERSTFLTWFGCWIEYRGFGWKRRGGHINVWSSPLTAGDVASTIRWAEGRGPEAAIVPANGFGWCKWSVDRIWPRIKLTANNLNQHWTDSPGRAFAAAGQ